jgi:hypothetical protein
LTVPHSGDARHLLEALLRPAARRLALDLLLRTACRMLGGVATGVLGGLLVSAAFSLAIPWQGVAGGSAAAFALGLGVAAARSRLPLLAVARTVDVRLGLADQLGTAVDLLERPRPPGGLAALQVARALEVGRRIDLAAACPLRVPREAVPSALAWALVALWMVLPAAHLGLGTPGVRVDPVLSREGGVLRSVGEDLASRSRAAGLPESRRAAERVSAVGRQLERSGRSRAEALALLGKVGADIRAAGASLERRVTRMLGSRRPPEGRVPSERVLQELGWADQALRTVQAVDEALSGKASSGSSRELARQLRDLGTALQRSGAPEALRRTIDRARRDLEAGSPHAASQALGESLQDLRALARMLGDMRGLEEAQRAVAGSSRHIAGAPPASADRGGREAEPSPPGPSAASRVPGPIPPALEPGEGTPPPPGPHQGSLPGQGRGGGLGTRTPRLGGTHVPVRISGSAAGGPAVVREVVGPGRVTSAVRRAGALPADVAHELDATLEQDPLPPAYRTVVERYFREASPP